MSRLVCFISEDGHVATCTNYDNEGECKTCPHNDDAHKKFIAENVLSNGSGKMTAEPELETQVVDRSMYRCLIKEGKSTYKKYLKTYFYVSLIILACILGYYAFPIIISYIIPSWDLIVSTIIAIPWWGYIIIAAMVLPTIHTVIKCVKRDIGYWSTEKRDWLGESLMMCGLLIVVLSIPVVMFGMLLVYIMTPLDVNLFVCVLVLTATCFVCGIALVQMGYSIRVTKPKNTDDNGGV